VTLQDALVGGRLYGLGVIIDEIRVHSWEPDVWPFTVPAIRAMAAESGLKLTSPVTFLVGENGSGKSTIIEAIAEAFHIFILTFVEAMAEGSGTRHSTKAH
jgi:predicted ATPase